MKHAIALFFLVLPFWFIPGNANCQSITELMSQAAKLEKELDETSALFKYKEVLKQDPNHFEAIKKVSWLYNTTGFRIGDNNKKREYYQQGLIYAKKAYAINPNDAQANYLMALSVGRIAQLSSPKERVSKITVIHKFGATALKLDPNHYYAAHILGRLYYRVANLSVPEKAAANLLFGGLPKDYTNEKAVAYYNKCLTINPDFILARRDIGLALLKLKEKEKAKAQFKKALITPNVTPDDPQYKVDCKKFLEKLQ